MALNDIFEELPPEEHYKDVTFKPFGDNKNRINTSGYITTPGGQKLFVKRLQGKFGLLQEVSAEREKLGNYIRRLTDKSIPEIKTLKIQQQTPTGLVHTLVSPYVEGFSPLDHPLLQDIESHEEKKRKLPIIFNNMDQDEILKRLFEDLVINRGDKHLGNYRIPEKNLRTLYGIDNELSIHRHPADFPPNKIAWDKPDPLLEYYVKKTPNTTINKSVIEPFLDTRRHAIKAIRDRILHYYDKETRKKIINNTNFRYRILQALHELPRPTHFDLMSFYNTLPRNDIVENTSGTKKFV